MFRRCFNHRCVWMKAESATQATANVRMRNRSPPKSGRTAAKRIATRHNATPPATSFGLNCRTDSSLYAVGYTALRASLPSGPTYPRSPSGALTSVIGATIRIRRSRESRAQHRRTREQPLGSAIDTDPATSVPNCPRAPKTTPRRTRRRRHGHSPRGPRGPGGGAGLAIVTADLSSQVRIATRRRTGVAIVGLNLRRCSAEAWWQ